MKLKKTIGTIGFPLLGLFTLFSASSCTEEVVCPDCTNLPTVDIEVKQMGDYSQCRVCFTPSPGTDYFMYYLGKEDDLAAFEAGTLDGVQMLKTDREQEVIFRDLEIKREYCLFARAYNNQGDPGGVAMLRFFNGVDVTLNAQYVASTSAGIVIAMGDGWSECRYYLGTPQEREDFLSGKIEGSTIAEKERYVVTRFDLEPETDYVLYVVPVNRMGVEYDAMEYSFTTMASGEGPATELDFPVRDVYQITARLTPNEYCYKIVAAVALLSMDGTQNTTTHSMRLESDYDGDVDAMLKGLTASQMTVSAYNGNPLEVPASMRTLLECGCELELYVGMYDESDNFLGAEYYRYSTPSFDESAGEATAEVEIVDIINGGSDWGVYHSVKAIITPNEHTLGYFVKMMGANDYEQAQQKEDPDAYIRDMLMNDWSSATVFTYGNYPIAYTNEKIYSWYTENYIVVCPFNANGVDGWGPVVAHYFEIK